MENEIKDLKNDFLILKIKRLNPKSEQLKNKKLIINMREMYF